MRLLAILFLAIISTNAYSSTVTCNQICSVIETKICVEDSGLNIYYETQEGTNVQITALPEKTLNEAVASLISYVKQKGPKGLEEAVVAETSDLQCEDGPIDVILDEKPVLVDFWTEL